MDALLLPFYHPGGFAAVAVYRVAVFFISFIQLPMKALIPASYTVLAKAFAEDDKEKATDLFLRASINIFIPTVGVSVILCCNLQNIVSVIKEGYSEIIPVFLVLLLGSIVNVITGMNDQVLSITKYYKFNFYLSLLLLLVLFILIRILVPRYGLLGAAWGTTTTIIIFNALKCMYIWKRLRMIPFSKDTLLVIVAALPAIAVGYFLPYFWDVQHHVYLHTLLDVALRSTAVAGIYVLMLLWLKPSKDLEEYLLSVRKNKRLF